MNTLPHLFVLATLGLTSFALAAPITTYRFSGTVSAVGSNLGSTVQVGNAYAADFTFDEAIAQLGAAVGAQVVDGKHLTVHVEQGNVLPLRGDGDACAFKQISLGGHVGPVAHSQIG